MKMTANCSRTDRPLCLMMLMALFVAQVSAQETVSFSSDDGHQLSGTLWANAKAPGVLLLHQCNSDRSMYEEVGDMLAAAGFKVLTLDFRGFGGSKSDELDLSGADRDTWRQATAKFSDDAEAAHGFLREHGGGAVVGALGASCGGREVLGLGQRHSDLGRLGFFSSRLTAENERDLLGMEDRKFLMIAAKGDTGAVGPAGKLAYRAKSRTELLLYEGDAHGYPLFEQDPELAGKIVSFFEPLLNTP